MALKKPIQTRFGICAVYIKIGVERKDLVNKTQTIILFGYPSESIRRANVAPIYESKPIVINNPDYLLENSIDGAYKWIKENLAEWKDAQNC